MRHCAKCEREFDAGESICPHDGTILEDTLSFEEQAVGKTLDGKYRIDGFLTRGGMGAVYRGTHVMLNKPVAIKLIKPELMGSRDIVERFLREARAAAHLSHPNIVTVHDLGQTSDGMLYIAMELVDGKSLKQLIVEEGACEPARAVRLLRGVTKALALAHREGVLHRDLKPQNIMVTEDAHGEEIPKLLDFGIAKTLEPDSPALTATGMVLGTPHYMSTEQAKGQPADRRSDLYALGVILYEMLIGKVPFDDASIPQILIKHLNEIPKPPSELNASIPAALSAIVVRLLEKNPDDRFQDAESLLEALDKISGTLTGAAMAAGAGVETVATMATAPIPQRDMETSVVQETTMAGGVAAAMPPPPLPIASSAPSSGTTTPTIRARDAVVDPGGESKWKVWMVALAALVFAVAAYALWPRGAATEAADADASAETASLASLEPGGAESGSGTSPSPPPDASGETAVAVASSSESATPPTTREPAARETSAPPPAPPRKDPPVPTAAGTNAATTASANTEPSAAASASGGAAPEPRQRPAPAAAPEPVPAIPTVMIRCDGVRDGCAAIRRAVAEECRRRNVPLARGRDADVVMTLDVEEIEARSEQQFGTTFVTRTYSVEATGNSRHFEDEIFFAPETVTFDARLGRDKLMEQSRLIARNLVGEIQKYWSEQTGR